MALPESEIRRFEEYHQVRRRGEFPGSMTIAGAINGGVLGGIIFGPLGSIVGVLGGGGAGYLYDKRNAGQAMRKFIQRQVDITSQKLIP